MDDFSSTMAVDLSKGEVHPLIRKAEIMRYLHACLATGQRMDYHQAATEIHQAWKRRVK